MAYICIYVDIVVNQNSISSNQNRKIVLIIIAFYGTGQLAIKLILAIFHHFSWMLSGCCQNHMEEGRVEKVNQLWNSLYKEYEDI